MGVFSTVATSSDIRRLFLYNIWTAFLITLELHLQTSPDGVVTEIEGSKSASYDVSCSDIGFLISVSCEPIRSDWVHGPRVTSEHIGPIIPGMLIT